MNIWWGVDSLIPANYILNNLKDKPTVYQYVVDKMERAPDFWGRYIVGTQEQRLLREEADFLLARDCRILPIFNQAHVSAGLEMGREDARKALKAASDLSIPAGVWIYADIEPGWKPTRDWIRGWWDGMYNSMYGGCGGLYCNSHPINTYFTYPYGEALKMEPTSRNILFNSYLWAQTPAKGCSSKPSSMQFTPDSPKSHLGGARVWQYATKCLVGAMKPGKELVDMDLANDTGYDGMWKGSGGTGSP
jgi:hypothetical protein